MDGTEEATWGYQRFAHPVSPPVLCSDPMEGLGTKRDKKTGE
jgi:hypothetical protein